MPPLVKLGRRAIKPNARRKLVGHHLLSLLPEPPDEVDNTDGVTQWGMMKNDQLGDCTCAGMAHSLQVATLSTKAMYTAPDTDVVGLYEKSCGYIPGKDQTDEGGVEDDVITYVEKNGFSGAKLLGSVSIDTQNIRGIKQAIANFRSIYIGAEMPISAQTSGGVWDVVGGVNGVVGAWGGHCMVGAKYTKDLAPWITWGGNQDSTWHWLSTYVDEVHVLLWDVLLQAFPAATQDQILTLLHSLG